MSGISRSLFKSLKIRGVEIRNRLGVSPMCQYSSTDGFFNEWHLVHLGSRAVGGNGLVMIEATAVEPEGRISGSDAGLWKDDHIDYLSKIAGFVKQQGGVIGIQLSHAGRKGSTAAPWKGGDHLKNEDGGWETKGVSPIQFDETHLWKTPSELKVNEIERISDSFAAAAKRAISAGIQVIEIHAANGYLIHQFSSPLSNKRTDQYGGSFEKRIRFITEVVTKIRASIPAETPLFVRQNCTDWHKDGWNMDDTVALAKILKSLGVDLIDVSSGFVIPNYRDVPFAPGFQVPFAERIKKEAGILTAAVGVITEAAQAEEIVKDEKADIVFMARESLRDPFFPFHAGKTLGVEAPQSVLPIQYSHWLGRW